MNKLVYTILSGCMKLVSKQEPVPYEESKWAKQEEPPKSTDTVQQEPAQAEQSEDKEGKALSTADEGQEPDATESTSEHEPPTKAKKKLAKPVIYAAAVLAVFAVIVLAVKLLGSKKAVEVDLTSVIVLEEQTGINGRGEVSFQVDVERLKDAIFASTDVGTDAERAAYAQEVAKHITISLPEDMKPGEMRLKNGDVITITVAFAEEEAQRFAPFQFQPGTITYEVNGLFDGEELEPFAEKYITIQVEGNSGVATASLITKHTGSFSYYLNYDLTPNTGLSNGDIVTVTIDPDIEKLAELRYTVGPERSFDYVVSGLNEFVTDTAEIPPLLINSMVNQAEGELTNDFHSVVLDDMDIVVTMPEITSIYYFDKIDKSRPYSDYFSGLSMSNGVMVLGHFFIQDVDLVANTDESGHITEGQHPEVIQTYGGYYSWIFPDVVKKPDGTISYNKEMVTKRSSSFQAENDFLAKEKTIFRDFAVTQIGSNG